MWTATPLSLITKKERSIRSVIINQLVARGFALIEVDDEKSSKALREGIEEARLLDGFRFPPINVDEIRYDQVHRDAFKTLFYTAVNCLSLLTNQDETDQIQFDRLFSDSANEPFPNDHLYHPTFFNLFNYNHGALNIHKDRGLVTVIHVDPPDLDPYEASSIWIEGSDQKWRSGDAMINQAKAEGSNKAFVLMLIGEEGETLFEDLGELGLYSADHSVRVRPDGEYIEYSHYKRDPASRETRNRLSAALILQRKKTSDDI